MRNVLDYGCLLSIWAIFLNSLSVTNATQLSSRMPKLLSKNFTLADNTQSEGRKLNLQTTNTTKTHKLSTFDVFPLPETLQNEHKTHSSQNISEGQGMDVQKRMDQNKVSNTNIQLNIENKKLDISKSNKIVRESVILPGLKYYTNVDRLLHFAIENVKDSTKPSSNVGMSQPVVIKRSKRERNIQKRHANFFQNADKEQNKENRTRTSSYSDQRSVRSSTPVPLQNWISSSFSSNNSKLEVAKMRHKRTKRKAEKDEKSSLKTSENQRKPVRLYPFSYYAKVNRHTKSRSAKQAVAAYSSDQFDSQFSEESHPDSYSSDENPPRGSVPVPIAGERDHYISDDDHRHKQHRDNKNSTTIFHSKTKPRSGKIVPFSNVFFTKGTDVGEKHHFRIVHKNRSKHTEDDDTSEHFSPQYHSNTYRKKPGHKHKSLASHSGTDPLSVHNPPPQPDNPNFDDKHHQKDYSSYSGHGPPSPNYGPPSHAGNDNSGELNYAQKDHTSHPGQYHIPTPHSHQYSPTSSYSQESEQPNNGYSNYPGKTSEPSSPIHHPSSQETGYHQEPYRRPFTENQESVYNKNSDFKEVVPHSSIGTPPESYKPSQYENSQPYTPDGDKNLPYDGHASTSQSVECDQPDHSNSHLPEKSSYNSYQDEPLPTHSKESYPTKFREQDPYSNNKYNVREHKISTYRPPPRQNYSPGYTNSYKSTDSNGPTHHSGGLSTPHHHEAPPRESFSPRYPVTHGRKHSTKPSSLPAISSSTHLNSRDYRSPPSGPQEPYSYEQHQPEPDCEEGVNKHSHRQAPPDRPHFVVPQDGRIPRSVPGLKNRAPENVNNYAFYEQPSSLEGITEDTNTPNPRQQLLDELYGNFQSNLRSPLFVNEPIPLVRPEVSQISPKLKRFPFPGLNSGMPFDELTLSASNVPITAKSPNSTVRRSWEKKDPLTEMNSDVIVSKDVPIVSDSTISLENKTTNEKDPLVGMTSERRESSDSLNEEDHDGFLDMGAYTDKHGSFGWYADFPVGRSHDKVTWSFSKK